MLVVVLSPALVWELTSVVCVVPVGDPVPEALVESAVGVVRSLLPN